METKLQRMKVLLDKMKQGIKTPNPIRDVNLFSILGMENKEVPAHSAFLYYVLKPFSDQNGTPDDMHLKMFLKKLREAQIQKMGTSDIPEEPEYADIYREYATDFGRLDFLIVFGNDGKQDAAVIELKIWAGEQPEQIPRYRAFMRSNGYSENNIFFLTPGQRESQTGDSQNITLKDTITPLFNEIILKRKQESSAYAEVLNQYTTIIGKLTGADSFMTEEIKLFHSKLDIQAAEELFDAKNKILAYLLNQFMDELKYRLVKEGKLDLGPGCPELTIVDVDQSDSQYISDYYKRGKKYPALCFRVDDPSKLKKDFQPEASSNTDVYFFVEIESCLYAGFTPRVKRERSLVISSVTETQKEVLKKESCNCSDTWFMWQHVSCNGIKKISFSDYLGAGGMLELLEDSEESNDLLEFDPGNLNSIALSIKKICKDQCKILFDDTKEGA